MGFLKVLLTQSFIVGDVAPGKQAGILSREFVSTQRDRTKDEIIDTGRCLVRVKLRPLQAECRERKRKRELWNHLLLLDVPTSHAASFQVFRPPQPNTQALCWRRL